MFILKTTLEVAACVLLILGYLNEEKVIAFERALWKKITSGSRESSQKHSATYYASREASCKAQNERERIARSAEYARAHAVIRNTENEPRRVA